MGTDRGVFDSVAPAQRPGFVRMNPKGGQVWKKIDSGGKSHGGEVGRKHQREKKKWENGIRGPRLKPIDGAGKGLCVFSVTKLREEQTRFGRDGRKNAHTDSGTMQRTKKNPKCWKLGRKLGVVIWGRLDLGIGGSPRTILPTEGVKKPDKGTRRKNKVDAPPLGREKE